MNPSRTDIAAMVAGVFAELGSEAVFTKQGGAGVAVRAVPRIIDIVSPDPLAAPQTGRVMSLLVSAVSDRPGKGDTITITAGGFAMPGVYPVLEEALCEDMFQLVYVCRVGEPA